MKPILLLCIFALMLQAQHKLTVKVTNIRKEKGDIRVTLFDSKNHYESSKGFPLQQLSKRAQKPTVSVDFLNLSSGEYTLLVYHDRNLDGKLDRNNFNTPKEPHGYSNNFYWDIFKPPYDSAKIVVTRDTTHTIKLD